MRNLKIHEKNILNQNFKFNISIFCKYYYLTTSSDSSKDKSDVFSSHHNKTLHINLDLKKKKKKTQAKHVSSICPPHI